jgi:hypothetical protein
MMDDFSYIINISYYIILTSLTTRNSAKTNEITDGMILSVIIIDEVRSVCTFVSLYRHNFAIGNNYRWLVICLKFSRYVPTD